MFCRRAGRCSLSPRVWGVPGVFGGCACGRPPLFFGSCAGVRVGRECGWARVVLVACCRARERVCFWFCAYWVRERWCVRRVWVSFACPRALFEREIRWGRDLCHGFRGWSRPFLVAWWCVCLCAGCLSALRVRVVRARFFWFTCR